MTVVEDGRRATGRVRQVSTAVATFLVFAVVGPAIGGATTFLIVLGLDAVPPDFTHDLGGAFFYSCLTVVLPVAVVGALVAVRQAIGRPVAATLATSLGASAGVIWGLFLASEGTTATLSVLAFVGATMATLVCWWLTRIFARTK